MMQASRDVTKTGTGPHQPTVPEICSPRQRACSVRTGGGQEWQSVWGAAPLHPTPPLHTHQAGGGSFHYAHTSPGSQAPGEELWGC